MTSGEAFEPAMTRATSPGTALTRTKVNMAVPKSVMPDQKSRVTNRASISVVDPHLFEAPEPDRVRAVAAQARTIKDGNLFVEDGHPRRVAHDEAFGFPKQPQSFVGVIARPSLLEARVDIRIVVKRLVVAIGVGNPVPVQQHVEEIARVRIILHPTPETAGNLATGPDFHLEGGITDRLKVRLNADFPEVLLDACGDAGVSRAREDKPQLGFESVRVACLAQERTGGCRVVVAGGEARIRPGHRRGDDAVRHGTETSGQPDVTFLVQSVIHRAADP